MKQLKCQRSDTPTKEKVRTPQALEGHTARRTAHSLKTDQKSYALLIAHIRAICPTHLILLVFVNVTSVEDEARYVFSLFYFLPLTNQCCFFILLSNNVLPVILTVHRR